jgi:chemotaxis signal transduction protein
MNPLQTTKGGLHTPLQQLILLAERVRQAGASLPDAGQEQALHGIKCVIAGRNCIIKLREVAEVIDSRPVAAVPGTAPWVEGVFNYRGALVPVYRLGDFFPDESGQAPPAAIASSHIVVLRKDRKGREFNAIRVDRLYGMQKFREAEIQPHSGAADPVGGLEQVVASRLSSEDGDWLLLDIVRLMELINATPPFHQQAPGESNSRRES